MTTLLLPSTPLRPFTCQRSTKRNVSRRLSLCTAQQQQQGEGAPRAPAQAAPRRQFTPPADFNPDVKVEKMQNMSEEVWEGSGVVQMEAANLNEEPTDLNKVGLLIAGDTVALLAFAAIGRASHGEALTLGAVWDTAMPFVLGWFATAPFSGAYGKEAQGWDAGKAAGTAAKSWAVALPVGHAIRALMRGYLPPTPFLLASLGSTLVLLVGYRTAVAAVTPEPPPMTPYEKMLRRHSKSGGPLDFLRFIQSMTRRW